MRNWRYWRWQVMRNLPFAALVALLIAVLGSSALRVVPTKFTAITRLVLERPIGLSNGSRAQSSAEEVQHLQIVTHGLDASRVSENLLSDQTHAHEFKIETSRDKPTFLFIKVAAESEVEAIDRVKALSAQAIAQSREVQSAREENTLGKLGALVADTQKKTDLAQEAFAAHLSGAPSGRLDEFEAEASDLHQYLSSIRGSAISVSPELTKLHKDLSDALSLYSDIHPKVRLIRARIERNLSETPQGREDVAAQADLQKRLREIEAEVSLHRTHDAIKRDLEQEVASSVAAHHGALDALRAAQSAAEASRVRLKVVQDPTIDGLNQQRMRIALLTALTVICVTGAIGAVALRIKLDDRLYRSCDLQRNLGLTPFATLPDLGPSLG